MSYSFIHSLFGIEILLYEPVIKGVIDKYYDEGLAD
jgi:hypothetical protein